MDTFDSHRSTVPARLPSPRPGASALRTTAGLPDATASPLSIRVALRGARRYWWLVLTLWVVGSVGIGAVIYTKVKPSYRAISLLQVDPAESNIYGVRTRAESLEPYLMTQVQLITSPNVLTAAGTNARAAALARIRNADDVVQELRKVISVQVIPQTYLIEVSMTSPSPVEAATLVNAVVGAFMDSNIEWSDGMTRTQIKNLESYLVDLRQQTDEMERRWKELVYPGDASRKARQSSPIGPEYGAKIDEKLIDNDLRRIEAQGRLDALRGRDVKDAKQVEELETEIEAAKNIDRALNARRGSGGFDAGNLRTNEVEITLIREQREILKSMQEPIMRRLEQLKFEARGEARIRQVNDRGALVPGRPLDLWYRPWVLLGIPFATFAVTLGLFAGVEAWSGSSDEAGEDMAWTGD